MNRGEISIEKIADQFLFGDKEIKNKECINTVDEYILIKDDESIDFKLSFD